MSELIFVLGETGTGKSHSLKNFDPTTTFIIKCVSKKLPWRGSSKQFDRQFKNTVVTDDPAKIQEILFKISEKMPKVTDIVIDDFQYMMSFEYLRKIDLDVWDTFRSIGANVFNVLNIARTLREDINVFILSHTDTTVVKENAFTKIKTVGKMVDDKITPEGLATVVLYTKVIPGLGDDDDNEYKFTYHNTGNNTAKAPPEMFKSKLIPNDLAAVSKALRGYY